MADMNRRQFLRRGGLATTLAAGALAVPVTALDAVTTTDAASATTYDQFVDQGGQVFNVKNPAYGAAGDGTTDDTAAILAAFSAAGDTGTVYFPAGTYKILGASNGGGPLVHTGRGGIKGRGGKPDSANGSAGNSVLLCGDATAGIVLNGCARYESFMVDGNNTATAPLRTGVLASNQVTDVGSFATFIDVWARRSAGKGWSIYGAQNCGYYDCGTINNAGDGLYIDGGAGGLDFFHLVERGNQGYGVHGDNLVKAKSGSFDPTRAVRFYSGSFETDSARQGTSKVYLRAAYDWTFRESVIDGTHQTGPAIDLNQSVGYGLDFAGCWIDAKNTQACIKVQGTPPSGTKVTFVKTDGCHFQSGANSVSVQNDPGTYQLSAAGGWWDETSGGPTAAAGLAAVDTLFTGRTGPWQSATASGSWSGTISYRYMGEGWVELRGNVTTATGAVGTIATLPDGYRPGGSATRRVAAAASSGLAVAGISTGGAVSANAVGAATFPAGTTVYLDGVSFPIDG